MTTDHRPRTSRRSRSSQLSLSSLGVNSLHTWESSINTYKPIMNAKEEKEIVSRYKLTYFRVSINEESESHAGWRRIRGKSANGSWQSARGYPKGEDSVE